MASHISVLSVTVLLAATLANGTAVPRTELTVKVPEYEAKKQGDLTEVKVPGGGVLYVEEGRPRVPYFTSWFGYPSECRVQEVTLKGKAGAKVDSGLRLPVVHFSSYNDPIPAIKPKPGPYPAQDFSWRAVEGAGDEVLLAITVYPYRFDPGTGVGTFHSRYDFSVRYVTAEIGIGYVYHLNPVCDPGDTLETVLVLAGSAEQTGLRIRPTVRSATTGSAVSELAEMALDRAKPGDSVVVDWPTKGRTTGEYLMDLVLLDQSGAELDRERASLRLGTPQGEVTAFTVEPQCFDIGDDIRITLEFRNTGSITLDGRCVFRIMKADEVVDQFEQKMEGLNPGSVVKFRQSWSTSDAERSAIYRAVGFVKYEGTACEPRSAVFSTNRMPDAGFSFAPDTALVGGDVEFDAAGSKDEDGEIIEYRWEFGDGGTATGVNAAHAWMQPGEFSVRLTVADNEGGIASAEQTVVVAE